MVEFTKSHAVQIAVRHRGREECARCGVELRGHEIHAKVVRHEDRTEFVLVIGACLFREILPGGSTVPIDCDRYEPPGWEGDGNYRVGGGDG